MRNPENTFDSVHVLYGYNIEKLDRLRNETKIIVKNNVHRISYFLSPFKNLANDLDEHDN